MRAPKLEIVTPPAAEPVTAADLAAFLGASASDPLLDPLVKGARDLCEKHLGIALITQVWKQFFDVVEDPHGEWWDGVRDGATSSLISVPQQLKLALYPLISVASVNFYDDLDAATLAESASYYVSTSSRPPTITLRPGYSWPSVVHRVSDAIVVQGSFGFGAAAANVPDALKNGIKVLAAFNYEHRGECSAEEAIIKSGAAGHWAPYRIAKT